MSSELENPVFDVDDNTALVCVDQQQYQKLVVSQLMDMGYKVHLGLFEEDVLVKLADLQLQRGHHLRELQKLDAADKSDPARNDQPPRRATSPAFRRSAHASVSPLMTP